MTEQVSLPATVPTWTLGDRLRKARRHAGLEQTELAAEIGIARSSIVNYEMDRKSPPRPVLLAWAFRCGVPLGWLATGEINGPTEPGSGMFAQFDGGVSHRSLQSRKYPYFALNTPSPLTPGIAA